MLTPKSFAGFFGAAPSVAIAAFGLPVLSNGNSYAALEGRSMIVGALAFFVYACVSAHVMAKHRFGALSVTLGWVASWLGCALGAWLVILR